jgi:hypothetical protein
MGKEGQEDFFNYSNPEENISKEELVSETETKDINFEDCFLKGRELEYFSPSKEGLESTANNDYWVFREGKVKNLETITGEEIRKRGGMYENFGKNIKVVNQGEYNFPSGKKMRLNLIKYNSPELANKTGESLGTIFTLVKGDTLLWIDSPTIKEFMENMSSKEKKAFSKMISDYTERTNMVILPKKYIDERNNPINVADYLLNFN